MRRRWIAAVLTGTMALSLLTGCGAGQTANSEVVKLDPNNPVSLTIWHYYNGAQQAAFDQLVQEFNASVGKEKGIYVEGYSQGSVSDLEKAVSDSVAEKVGAQSLPDVFSTYADTAYAVQQQGKLADLNQYFTADELADYVDAYIQEGHFHGRRTFFVLNYPLVHLLDFFGFVYIVCLKLYSKQTLFPDFSENKMFFNSACSAQDTDIPCPSCTFFSCFSGPSLHSFPVSTGSGLYDGSGSCFLPHSLNASCNCLR